MTNPSPPPNEARRGRTPYARPVVLSCDRNYAGATITCLTSLYLNSPSLEFDTFWFTSAHTNSAKEPEVVAAISRLADTFQRHIHLVTLEDGRFEAFTRPRLEYLGNVTYGRLLIPGPIPADSYLFLDSDIIVQENIEPLLALPLGDHLIAGVQDSNDEVWLAMERERLGLAGDEIPINAGVTVVDANRWRSYNVLETLLDWYDGHASIVELADQDMVNAILGGRKKLLDHKWNVMQHALSDDERNQIDPESFRGILHFTGPIKPWLDSAPVNLRALYEKYAQVSPMRMRPP